MTYWSDEQHRNRENRPRPFGLRVKIRPYFVVALDGGPATACALRLVWPNCHPSDMDLSPGTPDCHPSDMDLSPGTPDCHPSDMDLSPGTPDFDPQRWRLGSGNRP